MWVRAPANPFFICTSISSADAHCSGRQDKDKSDNPETGVPPVPLQSKPAGPLSNSKHPQVHPSIASPNPQSAEPLKPSTLPLALGLQSADGKFDIGIRSPSLALR